MTQQKNFMIKIKEQVFNEGVNGIIAKYILNNLSLISKTTENDFISKVFITKKNLDEFLQSNDLINYQDLITQINLCLQENKSLQKTSNQLSDLHVFYNDLLNSLNLNFQTIIFQENVFEKIIKLLKKANHLYFFANEHDRIIVEEFALNLSFLGFSTNVITDDLKMQEKSAKINKNDLIFYFFDDYKNR